MELRILNEEGLGFGGDVLRRLRCLTRFLGCALSLDVRIYGLVVCSDALQWHQD